MSDEKKAQQLISIFVCQKDLDVEKFLKEKAIMLECKDIPYLISLYEAFGFNKLEKEYDKGELIQMIKILEEDEVIEPQNHH